MTTKEIIAALERGAQANRQDKYRKGNLVELPHKGLTVMTGDLHGHDRNFDRLVTFSNLSANKDTHLILHEILHGSQLATPNECHSFFLLARVAELKSQFPDQVHVLMGNHAMAQVTRDEVLKGGQPMVRALNQGLMGVFADRSALVRGAMEEFILSMPIAAKAPNGIWMSHSLPTKRHLKDFDDAIFDKLLTLNDLKHDAGLHALTWDRRQCKNSLEKLQEMWHVELFIVGHQPQGQGYDRPQERLIILASDHSHGCFLPFDLSVKYEPDELFEKIRPLAEIA